MHDQRGFGYIEALVAVVLLAVVLVPALDALGNIARTAPAADGNDDLWMAVSNKLNQVSGSRFDDLDFVATYLDSHTTPSTTYSDPADTLPSVQVYVSRYDGDNADGDNDVFTGTDPDLIWVRAAIAGTPVEMTTLVTR